MKSFAFACCAGIVVLVSANAQEFSKFSFDIGGGYVVPVGGTGHYLDTGWGVRAGVGANFSPHVGIMLNLGYDSMGINSPTLANVGAAGGDVNVFHATVDPVVRLTPKGRISFYLTGGGGLFHRYQEFSAPTAGTTGAYIPFLGFSAGANPMIAAYAVNKPGFDAGAGVEVGALGHGKFFTEARWDHMFLAGGHTDFIPVSFGFRW